MKIYTIYISYDNSLYAYSAEKDTVDSFMIQRNQKLFTVKSIHLQNESLSIFMYQNRGKQLIHDVLYDGKNDISIICTVDESNKLSESCEYIQNTVNAIRSSKYINMLTDEMLDVILYLTDIINKRGKYNSSLKINTFNVFWNLFRYTFTDSPNPKNMKGD